MTEGTGIADLELAPEEGGQPSYEQARLEKALLEVGINPELLTPLQREKLRQEMILDYTPFDEPGLLLELLRNTEGFDAILEADELDKTINSVSDKLEFSGMAGLILDASSEEAELFGSSGGKGNGPLMQHAKAPEAPSAAYMEAMSRRSRSSH